MNRSIETGDMEKLVKLDAGAFDMDVEPDDIKASDAVTVVWEIK